MHAEQAAAQPNPWHVPMTGRDPNEPHRAATPLELLFDLCFVVAVATAGTAAFAARWVGVPVAVLIMGLVLAGLVAF